MPIVKINVLEGISINKKKDIHSAIHNALVTSLEIQDWDYFHRIYEFKKEDFLFPESKSENFIIIEIHLYPGRTEDRKKMMYKEICDNLEHVGIPRLDIFIQVIEQPLQNWGIRGGIAASELSMDIK